MSSALLRDAIRELADDRSPPEQPRSTSRPSSHGTSVELLAKQDVLGTAVSGRARRARWRPPDAVRRHRAAQPRLRDDRADPRRPGARLAAAPPRRAPTSRSGAGSRHSPPGEQLIAFALTESEAGSDAPRARTQGDPRRRRLRPRRLQAVHQPGLGRRAASAVFAVTDPDRRRRPTGHDRFVVETGTPGFGVERLEHKMGIRGSPTAELTFDGVRVPDANRMGEVGEGWRSRCARSSARARHRGAGGRHRAGRARGRDARTRASGSQFGRPIGDFQMVGGMLADMAAADRGRPPAAVHRVRGDRGRQLPGRRRAGRRWPSCSAATPRCG